MEKKTLIPITCMMAGIGIATVSKSKVGKVLGGLMAIGGGIYTLLKDSKREYKKVEKEVEQVEETFKVSGLDPEKINTANLLVAEDGKDPVFGESFLMEAFNNRTFSDEMLEYKPENYLHTLHIMQNVSKNRVIVSIPLPPKIKKSDLSPQDIRSHYQEVYGRFIDKHKLEVKPYLNQIGVHVFLGAENPPFTYFEEILKEPDETFRDYIARVNDIRDEFENGNLEVKSDDLAEGEKTLRFDQYLNLEFPVFPEHSNRKGMDLINGMELFRTLMEPAYIRCSGTGRDCEFELNQITFHPGDDLGTILTIKGGKIQRVDI